MAVTTGTSFLLATLTSVFVFSGMQMFKTLLGSSKLYTLLGGYLGSLLFVLCLTAFGNLMHLMFGKQHVVKVFPEVTLSLIIALFASATIHRVCGTTCLLFCLCSLYYVNKYSQKVWQQPAPVVVQPTKKRKNAS